MPNALMNANPNATPLVSVLMLAYNHAPYLRQAIESALAQRTSFPVRLVIGEDCSTDNTREIAQTFARQYPDRIHLMAHERNQGMVGNLFLTASHCNGRYIALLEGDDYWTDSSKLQRQVDLLESRPDAAVCFHPVEVRREGQRVPDEVSPFTGSEATIDELAAGNFMHTPSVVYRNGLFGEWPSWVRDCPAPDYALHMLNANHGPILHIPRTMAVYRLHAGGVWSAASSCKRLEAWCRNQRMLLNRFGPRVAAIQMRALARSLLSLYQAQVKAGLMEEASRSLKESCELDPRGVFEALEQQANLYRNSRDYRLGNHLLSFPRHLLQRLRRSIRVT